ncbi:zinc finger protein CONSTANS-LIKE 16-like isoform X2 [Gastrolobium bilobum]|uniref:zinc finger protein CONSTANS-LIKE 16-like isoform X2 n=1 Tax=Gastrolobium bilobum TaxID=150636 RepID=UPI002AAF9EA1|nr:zinc finger protein CONSTANS-LIKE 16-like isoform X2 [Gastrolobium bilobum]
MTSAKNVANAVRGKTARACDSCIRKRARWYCAADDAFLCEACDSSVHSANSLARRHERVRLKMASCKSSDCAPSWHRGFTKRARTPRHGKHNSKAKAKNPFHLVPEVVSDDTNSQEVSEEQLLYRVPIFDPFVAELCTTPSYSVASPEALATVAGCALEVEKKDIKNHGVESFNGFLSSDIELSEFAADVESLLGKGLENQCMGMEELGLIDCNEEVSSWECCVGSGKVKVEEDEKPEEVVDEIENMGREPFELSFDYDYSSVQACEEVEEKVALDVTKDVMNGGELKENNIAKRKVLLQLDYEAVIAAWASQKSPWITGDKPHFIHDHFWPHCMGACGIELHQQYGELGGLFVCHPGTTDGGREARVSRYREKRRTRLFSKKIRYEVRKLNAEKRPRMKGRFVKRASFAAPPTIPLINK